MLQRLVDETVKELTPYILGIEGREGLPRPDPDDTLEFTRTLRSRIFPEIHILGKSVYLLFNLYALFRTGRLFPYLDRDGQSALLEGLFNSGNRLVLSLLNLLTFPFFAAYYSRPDVQKLLGFDIVALKEESRLREVSRERSSPGQCSKSSRNKTV